jgi:hypothetical protein
MPSTTANYYAHANGSRLLEKEKSHRKRSKWIIFGVAAAFVGLIIIGVAVGVTVAKKKTSSTTSTTTTSSSPGSGSGPTTTNQTNPGDPSSFEKDPKLKLSFYGMAYTPEGSQLPNCGSKLCACNSLSCPDDSILMSPSPSGRHYRYPSMCNCHFKSFLTDLFISIFPSCCRS